MLKTVLFIFVTRNVERLIPEDYHDRYIDSSAVVHLWFSKGKAHTSTMIEKGFIKSDENTISTVRKALLLKHGV